MKTERENGVRKSCKAASSVMQEVLKSVQVGTTLLSVQSTALEAIQRQGAKSAFLGYRGYPGVLCLSVNEQVLHGIPSNRVILLGDAVKLDLGLYLDGWYSDMATTVCLGSASEYPVMNRLSSAVSASLMAGIRVARAGNHTRDIAEAVDGTLTSMGYKPVEEMCGHGVGHGLHESPQVPNCLRGWGGDDKLFNGMIIAIEPMAGAGSPSIRIMPDGWTVVMADREPSSHFEHTVLITDGDPEVLTA